MVTQGQWEVGYQSEGINHENTEKLDWRTYSH